VSDLSERSEYHKYGMCPSQPRCLLGIVLEIDFHGTLQPRFDGPPLVSVSAFPDVILALPRQASLL
jgi:hypothetical protein